MTLPARPTYLMNVYEKLGTPLLSAAVEAIERDALMARQQGQIPPAVSDTAEAERIAALLKSSAELGFALSRQIDVRMLDPAATDGVRLTLASIVAPLIANLYRVNGRTPTTPEIDRMVAAMQAVTMFSDHYNAAADASARMQTVEYDFAPADSAQMQLTLLNAFMPAVNAVCTFSFGQPEKTLLQDVITRLTTTAQKIRIDLFTGLSERDSLRAEISIVRAAANLYSQAHFTEMSKLMFLDDTQRDTVNLSERLSELWRVVDVRLSMVRVLAEQLVGIKSIPSSSTSTGGAGPINPSTTTSSQQNIMTSSGDSSFMMPTTPAATQSVQTMSATPAAGGSPFASFTTPKPPPASASATPSTMPSGPEQSRPVDKSNPLSMFGKPKETAGGNG